MLWAETIAQGFFISAVTVLLSSLFIYLDTRQLGTRAANGKKQTDPIVMLIASLVFWIVFFPWSFVRRSRITGRSCLNLSWRPPRRASPVSKHQLPSKGLSAGTVVSRA